LVHHLHADEPFEECGDRAAARALMAVHELDRIREV